MTRCPRTTTASRLALTLVGSITLVGCSTPAAKPSSQVFSTPEAAVQALNQAATKGSLDELTAIFGPDGKELVDTSDPETARRNQQVFTVAWAEGWHLVDEANGKVLVVGHEAWPFPVPLVKEGNGWRFDAAAGKEEILARRIGRNELAAIRVCKAYVAAQRMYAANGHDGQPAGIFAATFRSAPGTQNGLYWPARVGERRSPLGELVQDAEQREAAAGPAVPFHGYHFRILEGQGPAANGGAREYQVNGRMTGGFAMVAWPAYYDASGVMTFVVNQDGVVYQKDLGTETPAAVAQLKVYDPDPSWSPVE